MLGQVKVDSKSNEITAIPALLQLLDISGCMITIDAIGTQTAIAAQIIAQKGDYILCLKDNHPTLHQQVKEIFEAALKRDFDGWTVSQDQRVEGAHGRRELRQIWVLPVSQLGGLYQQEQWAGLQSVVMVYRRRQLDNGKVTVETQFFLSSLASDAQRIGRAMRLHWGIENQLHWVLDVTFGEDDSRIRKGHGPENFTLLRRMAISALNQETSSKRSIRQKAKLAWTSPDYMTKVLTSAAGT
jgi:predicted transposase YbfD/YdcC